MSDNSFTLRIMSPAGLAVEEQVNSVLFEAEDGQAGVLPRHGDYNGILGIGVLRYTPTLGKAQALVLEKGLCQFADNTLLILADAVYRPEPEALALFEREKDELQNFMQVTHYDEPAHRLAREQLACIKAIEEILGQ